MDPLTLLILGGIGLRLLSKSQAPVVGTGVQATVVPGSQVTAQQLVPHADPVQVAAQSIGAQIANQILPGAGVVVAPIVNTEVQAVQQIARGDVTPLNVAEVAMFPVAVTATVVNAIGDVLGWNSKPLGDVKYALIVRQSTPPNTRDNLGDGAINLLGANGLRYGIGSMNGGDLSWREIIAINSTIFDAIPDGMPGQSVTAANYRSYGITPAGRGDGTANAIRRAFGNDAIFKLGNSNTLYGPWNA